MEDVVKITTYITDMSRYAVRRGLFGRKQWLGMASRVAIMYLSQIVELGEARRIFSAPQHPYTQALLRSTMTVMPEGGVPDNALGHSYPDALDIPSGCSFHPRCLKAMAVCSQQQPNVVARNGGFVRCHLHTETDDAAHRRRTADDRCRAAATVLLGRLQETERGLSATRHITCPPTYRRDLWASFTGHRRIKRNAAPRPFRSPINQ
jgi:oligopeptide/dipeptide ABC transporter ATP-binding protein